MTEHQELDNPRQGGIQVIARAAADVVVALAGWNVSAIVAALLLGAQLLPVAHFEKNFKVSPKLVSQIGSLVWLAVAFVEMRLAGG